MITNPLAIAMCFVQLGACVWEFYHGRMHLSMLWFLYSLTNIVLGTYPK